MRKSSLIMAYALMLNSLLLAAPEDRSQAPTVFTEKATKKTISDHLTYPARVVPKVNATLLAEADGIVRKILAPLGHKAKANQTIMILSNTDPVYQYAPLRVRSPVGGFVSSVDVTEGSRVVKGQKLGSVTDPKDLKISIEVAASDLSSLKSGMEGDLEFPGKENAIRVRVQGISPFVDPATGTAPSELSLVSPSSSSLTPGMVGKVHFEVSMHEGFELPDFAILYKGKNPFVRIIVNNRAKFVPVRLGKTRKGSVEILEGLTEKNIVVLRTSAYVADGEKVIVEKDQVGKP